MRTRQQAECHGAGAVSESLQLIHKHRAERAKKRWHRLWNLKSHPQWHIKAIQLPIKQYLLLFPREFSHSGGWEFQYISVLAAIPTMATTFPQMNRLSRKEYSRPHLFCGEKNVVKENEVRCLSPIQFSKTDPCTLALVNHTQDKTGVPWMHHYMWLSQKALD